MRTVLLSLLVALADLSFGQSHASGRPSPTAADPQVEIPTRQLEFKMEEAVPGVNASPAIVVPTQCNAKGVLFLEMLSPPDFKNRVVYSVAEKKGQIFSASAITDVHDVQSVSMFPSTSALSILIRGTKEVAQPQPPADGSIPGATPTYSQYGYRYYIAQFDLDGSYQKSIELQIHNLNPFHFAVLSSGEFLVSGFDWAAGLPALLLIDRGGAVARSVLMPQKMADYAAPADPSSPETVLAAGKMAGSVLFTSYSDSIIVWRAGSNAPLLEVGAGGSTREIPVDSPKGFVLADIVPSNTNLLIHYRPTEQRTDAPVHNSALTYYEVRVADGSIADKLSMTGNAPSTLACESDGTFISYVRNDKGELSRLIAR